MTTADVQVEPFEERLWSTFVLFSQATYSVVLRTAGAGAPSALDETMVEGVDHLVPVNLE